ncbi:hypothetical protein AZA_76900 [Nitrospirillum viridazoti Y2]|nr:hypothetical protein AZA_76900 [Nitrospirillum amazonense Y2]
MAAAGLQGVESGVGAVQGQQLVMRAGFHHPAAIDDIDAVGIDDGGQAVGDDQGGAPLLQPAQGVLHQALGLAVQRRGRLVQQQHRGVLQHGAGDGDALALAAGQLHAILAHPGVIALGQAQDEVVCRRRLGRRLDLLLRGAHAAIGDIAAHRVVEQPRLLADQADGAAQRGQRHVADVLAAQGDGTAGDVVEAGDQVQDGGLARPAGPHQGHRLACRHLQRHAVQGHRAILVGEAHVIEPDGVGGDRQLGGARPVDDARRRVQQFEHPLRRGQADLQLGLQLGQALQRLERQQEGAGEAGQRAGGAVPRRRLQPAIDDDADEDDAAQHLIDGNEGGGDAEGLVGQLAQIVGDAGHTPHLILFHAVGLHMAGPLEGLGQDAGEGAERRLRAPRHPAQPAGHAAEHDGGEGHHGQRDGGQQPILLEHHAHQEDERQHALAVVGQHLRRALAHLVHVVHQAGDQLARRQGMQIGEVGLDQVVVELLLQRRHQPLAHVVHQHGREIAREAAHHEGGEDDDGEGAQIAGVLAAQHLIDQGHQLLRQHGGAAGVDGDEDAGQQHHADIGPQVVAGQAPHERQGGGVARLGLRLLGQGTGEPRTAGSGRPAGEKTGPCLARRRPRQPEPAGAHTRSVMRSDRSGRPSMWAVMRSPGTTGPTFSGVPVKIRSPGSRVKAWDRLAICSASFHVI